MKNRISRASTVRADAVFGARTPFSASDRFHARPERYLVRRDAETGRISDRTTRDHNRMMLNYAMSYAKAGESPARTLATQAWNGTRYLMPRLALCFLAKWTRSRALAEQVAACLAFRPTRPSHPDEIRDPELRAALREVRFTSAAGERIYGWHFPTRGHRSTVIYAAGNHQRLAELEPVVRLFSERGFGFLSYDHAGYGRSTGVPSQQGFTRSLEAAADHLAVEHQIPRDRTILCGNSLGCTVATDVASRRPGYQGVLLVAPFSSVADAFADRLRNYRIPRLLFDVSEHFGPCFAAGEFIHGVSAPLLMVHGGEDAIAPLPRAEELFERATGARKKTLLVVRDAGHADVFMRAHPEVFSEMGRLFGFD